MSLLLYVLVLVGMCALVLVLALVLVDEGDSRWAGWKVEGERGAQEGMNTGRHTRWEGGGEGSAA